MKGIEPSSSAWKAVALPLSYTRMLVEGGGSSVESQKLSGSRHSTLDSRLSTGECRIRTCEGISHQIYSLTRLTASVTPRAMNNSCSEPPRRGPTRHNKPPHSIRRSSDRQFRNRQLVTCNESRWSEHSAGYMGRQRLPLTSIRSFHTRRTIHISRASGGT